MCIVYCVGLIISAKGKLSDDEKAPGFYNVIVPKWPEDDALADKNRFYLVCLRKRL